MKNIIVLFLLCILNSLLFYKNCLGINVILFTIPLLMFLYYYLLTNKLIKNKYGLLFMIPIVVLSIGYSLYSNVLTELNIIVIPVLYAFMYVYTIKPQYNFKDVCNDLVKVLLLPIELIDSFTKDVSDKINKSIKLSDNNKKRVKSILIIIPIVLVVLLLLVSADMMFKNLFSGLFDLLKDFSLGDLIGRTILIIILFMYMGCSLKYLLVKYQDGLKSNSDVKSIDDYTIKLLLTVLNIIYIVFDIIQIRSLLFHRVATGINYAEYARSGFFQLMVISIINLVILLLSKRSKENNYTKYMSLGMVFLTFIIILSSIFRMYLYESAYGYTVLRLGVYTILFTEIILLIPTIIYIFKTKFNVFKYYLIIMVSVYTFINLFSVDYIIAYNNINRYYHTGKIDLDYLENYEYDNVKLLKDLHDKTDEIDIKEDLDAYFTIIKNDIDMDNIFEYKLSKSIAKNILK